MKWIIKDAHNGAKYVNIAYDTEREAQDARLDLLLIYPLEHEWRKRLVISPTDQELIPRKSSRTRGGASG